MGETTTKGGGITSARALFLAERFDLARMDLPTPVRHSPLVVSFGETIAVLFSYGVAVLFGSGELPPETLRSLFPGMSARFVQPESETAAIIIGSDERAGGGKIRLKNTETSRLQVVASVLAKSVVLAHYEQQISAAFDRVEPVAADIASGGRRAARVELLRQIGSALLVEARTLGRVEVVEKPDILWERDDLELLYAHLSAEYELKDRQEAIERKLSVIGRTAETLLSLVHDRHSLRVEWYIVILIVIEIVIMLYSMIMMGTH